MKCILLLARLDKSNALKHGLRLRIKRIDLRIQLRNAFVSDGNDARDAAAAAAYTELLAAELGLGCLYSGYFTACCAGSEAIRNLLGLKNGEQVVRCLVLGHPDVAFRRTAPRKPVSLTEL